MKTALYVAVVTRTYRQAIDDYYKDAKLYKSRMDYYREEISACTYRQFTTGFYFHKTNENSQIYDNNTYIKNYTYLGFVEEINDGLIKLHQKNKFSVGDEISFMAYDGENIHAVVKGMYDEKMTPMESAPHPKQLFYIELEKEILQDIKKGMIIRSRHCEA